MPRIIVRGIKAGILLLLAALLVITALYGSGSYAVTSFIFVILMLIPFYVSFEHKRPQARELVPIAIMAAVAALGRAAFAALPYVKPTSAIVIIAGIAFGPEAGFMTGATAALASNIFFGQGPFTPWQMFAWGIMGFCAGFIARRGLLRGRFSICLFGFIACFLYGWIMDTYYVLYARVSSIADILPAYAASLYFDAVHAASTAAFLLLLAKPWLRLLTRVKMKYGLMDG